MKRCFNILLNPPVCIRKNRVSVQLLMQKNKTARIIIAKVPYNYTHNYLIVYIYRYLAKMKHLTKYSLLCLVAMFMLFSCNMKAKKAKAYHDNVLLTTQGIIDSFLLYKDAIATYNKQTALEGHAAYSKQVDNALSKLEPMEDFDGNVNFKNSCVAIINFYKVNLTQRMEPFLNTVKGPEFTDTEAYMADSLLDVITNTEMPLWEQLDRTEKKFYRDFNLQVLEQK